LLEPVAWSVVLTVIGSLLQIAGVGFASEYVIAKVRDEALGKLGRLGAHLVQKSRAARSWTRRRLGLKPRAMIQSVKGLLTGTGVMSASPQVVRPKTKEQMMTNDAGTASVVCIVLGIVLVCIGSIVGTIWG
jgi:hypothetical protein